MTTELTPPEELGIEAVRQIEAEEFPVIVYHDPHGGDLLGDGKTEWRRLI